MNHQNFKLRAECSRIMSSQIENLGLKKKRSMLTLTLHGILTWNKKKYRDRREESVIYYLFCVIRLLFSIVSLK